MAFNSRLQIRRTTGSISYAIHLWCTGKYGCIYYFAARALLASSANVRDDNASLLTV
ncbi:hypothetical protein SCLCIDRAFT_1210919 [Scleroderma citrinum Foug A]|uniref:Uncharacterized protein n=1 Tax=Scleroderma citrinum Foug A TaxID=1036808 RepID=A0A0C3E220_9AGAM|nr:hypothetical protein SCLCIDRAFT_1210919 [Scleroderma citrinum Foug A]